MTTAMPYLITRIGTEQEAPRAAGRSIFLTPWGSWTLFRGQALQFSKANAERMARLHDAMTTPLLEV